MWAQKEYRTGELCFNTGMTGYQEIYTDPSYYGQIIVHTSVHIGNYGTKNEEEESQAPKVRGVVMQSASEIYSRASAQTESARTTFVRINIVAIASIDTRALVRHVIEKGVLNALISTTSSSVDTLKKSALTDAFYGGSRASQSSKYLCAL